MNPQALHAVLLGTTTSRREEVIPHIAWPDDTLNFKIDASCRSKAKIIPLEIVAFFMAQRPTILAILPPDQRPQFLGMVTQVQTKLGEIVRFNILEKKLVERALNAPMPLYQDAWVSTATNPDFFDVFAQANIADEATTGQVAF